MLIEAKTMYEVGEAVAIMTGNDPAIARITGVRVEATVGLVSITPHVLIEYFIDGTNRHGKTFVYENELHPVRTANDTLRAIDMAVTLWKDPGHIREWLISGKLEG